MVEVVIGKLGIDVYRKPTSIMRLIRSDFYHDHSMTHLMVNLPLSKDKIENERNKIIEIGRVKGYGEKTIRDIIEKTKREKKMNNYSTCYA